MKNVASINQLQPAWFDNLSLIEQVKLRNDIFYYSMVENGYSYDEIVNSGWINNDYSYNDLKEKYNLFMSQLEYYANKNKDNELFLLLNTGSYAPAHFGHISMLKQAQYLIKEKKLSSNPIMILSPSHDTYVLNKSDDIKGWDIDNRIKKLNETIREYPYKNDNDIILIDLWESIICDYPVNFTDVIKKIAFDLETLNIKFKIGYVFGSDNESFCEAFKYLPESLKDKYYAICIIREDYPIKNTEEFKNIFYIENIQEFSSCKSRLIRKNKLIFEDQDNTKNSFYGVREDHSIALKKWVDLYPQYKNNLIESYIEFNIKLSNLIEKYTGVHVEKIELNTQREYVKGLMDSNRKFINLDIGTNDIENQHSLNLGRLFVTCSIQNEPVKMIVRPEKNYYYQDIPKGIYTFVDDDIASGKTFYLVQKMLEKENIYFNDKINLAEKYCEEKKIKYSLYDIVDTKDFLIGSFSGGLLCHVNNKNIRVPYIYPFVNLNTRAKISYKDIKMFNKEVLFLNYNFFKNNNFLLRKDIDNDLIELYKRSIKIQENDKIENIIQNIIFLLD